MRKEYLLLFLIFIFGFSYRNTDLKYGVNIVATDTGIFYGKPYKNSMKIGFHITYKKKEQRLAISDVKVYANGIEQKDREIKEVIYYARLDKKEGIILGSKISGPDLPFSASFNEIFPEFTKKSKKKWFRIYKMSQNILARIDYTIAKRKGKKITLKEKITAHIAGANNLFGIITGSGNIIFNKGIVEKSDVAISSKLREKIQKMEIRNSYSTTRIKLTKE